MSIEENYVNIEHIDLTEEKCIQLIERELDSFFEIRLKLIYSICDSYIKGSIKSSDGIINFLDPSNDEVRAFIETMIYKLSSIINANFPKDSIHFNIYTINQYHINIEDSIDKFIKTEKVLNLCERILDKSLSNIFETYCKSGILNHFFSYSNLPKKILGSNSLKYQKQKHCDILFEQLKGYILNLKYDLRNNMIKSAILLINSTYSYDKKSIIA